MILGVKVVKLSVKKYDAKSEFTTKTCIFLLKLFMIFFFFKQKCASIGKSSKEFGLVHYHHVNNTLKDLIMKRFLLPFSLLSWLEWIKRETQTHLVPYHQDDDENEHRGHYYPSDDDDHSPAQELRLHEMTPHVL